MQNPVKSVLIAVAAVAVIGLLLWYGSVHEHRKKVEANNAAWRARLDSAKPYMDFIHDGTIRSRSLPLAEKAHEVVRQEIIQGKESSETWPPPDETFYLEHLFAKMEQIATSEEKADDAKEYHRLNNMISLRESRPKGTEDIKSQLDQLGSPTSQPSTMPATAPIPPR